MATGSVSVKYWTCKSVEYYLVFDTIRALWFSSNRPIL